MDFICRWIDVTKSQSIDQDLTDEQYEVILEMYKLCDGNPVAAERTILDIFQSISIDLLPRLDRTRKFVFV